MDRTYLNDPYSDAVIYTSAEFAQLRVAGLILSLEGKGYWMKDNHESNSEVFESPQMDATHVAWYPNMK